MKQILFTLFLLSSFYTIAQPYSTKDKKAIKLYEEAKKNYLLTYYNEALKPGMQAIKRDSAFVEAYFILAAVYKAQNKLDDDLQILQTCANRNGKNYPEAFVILAEEQLEYGKYFDASNTMDIILSMKQFFNQSEMKQIIDMKTRIDFCVYQYNHPVPFNPVNMGPEINTANDEYEPALTADGEEIIITCLLPIPGSQSQNSNAFQEDFFSAKKSNGKWLPRTDMGAPLNTPGNEGAQTISADGRIFFYTACSRQDSKGSCDIYYSVRKGGRWTAPRNMGSPVNSSYWESQPSCSADGRTLYFASNRPGGYGQMDIWETHLESDGKWSPPKNLGEKINTKLDELSPFIHTDGKTLYFASSGHIGMGKTDIFVSRKDTLDQWGTAKNVGYPINTWQDESDFRVSALGNIAIISSNRKGGFGGQDLYTTDVYNDIRPKEVSYVKGTIFDAKTQNKLSATFELIDIHSGDIIYTSFSDGITGQFLVPLPVNKEYVLNVAKEGYLFYSEHFFLKKEDSLINFAELNIPLQPIESGSKVVLSNVFFDTDSYILKDISRVELQKLIEFLQHNPNSKIEISGHTDNSGDKTKNLVLSNNRAKSVYDYLILNGISKDRLSYKGYGDTKPRVPNDSDQHKAMNRRTEFMIL